MSATTAEGGGTGVMTRVLQVLREVGTVRRESGRLLRDRPTRLWALGLVVTSLLGVGLAVSVADGRPILASRWALLVLLGSWALIWVLALACVSRLPSRRAVTVAIFVAGIAIRIASLAGPPTLSDDLYRYSWDAQTQLHGIDPYRYPPDAGALRSLRGPWLWPAGPECANLHRPPDCTRINRPAVRTIYPPVAEAYFAAVYALGDGMAPRHKLWQLNGLATDMATMALLARLLARTRRDPRWLAVYALCPLPAVEIVDNGHVDGLAVALLVGALLALGPQGSRAPRTAPSRTAGPPGHTRPAGAAGPPGRNRPTWRGWASGALVGAAALVKLYPAVMLIPLWAAPGVTRRDRLRVAAGAASVAVVGYAPHVAAVGPKVLGYLQGYLKEEHYTGQATRFLLADLLRLPPRGTDVVIGGVIAATVALMLRRRPDPAVGAAALVGVLLLCATPVQPWYGVALLALAAGAGRPEWGWVVLAGYPYFFSVILDSAHVVGFGRLSYAAGGLAAAGTALALRSSRRSRDTDPPGWSRRTAPPADALN